MTFFFKARTKKVADIETLLMKAAEKGKTSTLKRLMHQYPNRICRNSDRTTLLTIAVINGHYKTTKMLLEEGIDPNPRTGSIYRRPLTIACYIGNLEIAELLLKFNNNHQETSFCNSPLRAALHKDDKKMLELLLKNGITIDGLQRNGVTPIVELVKKQIPGNLDYNALTRAIAQQEIEYSYIKLLLENGADPNQIADYSRSTLMHMAACTQKLNVVRLLIQYGANDAAPNRYGQSPAEALLNINQQNNIVAEINSPRTQLIKCAYAELRQIFKGEDVGISPSTGSKFLMRKIVGSLCNNEDSTPSLIDTMLDKLEGSQQITEEQMDSFKIELRAAIKEKVKEMRTKQNQKIETVLADKFQTPESVNQTLSIYELVANIFEYSDEEQIPVTRALEYYKMGNIDETDPTERGPHRETEQEHTKHRTCFTSLLDNLRQSRTRVAPCPGL